MLTCFERFALVFIDKLQTEPYCAEQEKKKKKTHLEAEAN